MNKYYLMEMFEPTLFYGFALALLGVAAARFYGHSSIPYSILVVVGVVLAQMSVNVISDYFDYRSGLDRELTKSKRGSLSGGSSLLATGLIKPWPTLLMGLSTLAVAAVIGAYILITRIEILPILIIAVLSILLYARYIKRIPYAAEPTCAINFMLISLGSFIVISGSALLPLGILFSFIPAGIILGLNALFVNEVPDRAIDRKYGIRHGAVMLKTNKRIGIYYLLTQTIAFVIIAAGVTVHQLPLLSIACLVTIPATYHVFKGLYGGIARRYASYLRVHTIAAIALALIISASYVIAA